MPRSWHILSRLHATCFVHHLGFNTLMKFSADHRSLGYSRFSSQVTQAHRKLRGIAWQALETSRRTDGVKRKRLKLRNNVSTWNANRNNNVMQCGSFQHGELSFFTHFALSLWSYGPQFFPLVPRYYGHWIFPPRVSAIMRVDSPPAKLFKFRQWIIIGLSFKNTAFKSQHRILN